MEITIIHVTSVYNYKWCWSLVSSFGIFYLNSNHALMMRVKLCGCWTLDIQTFAMANRQNIKKICKFLICHNFSVMRDRQKYSIALNSVVNRKQENKEISAFSAVNISKTVHRRIIMNTSSHAELWALLSGTRPVKIRARVGEKNGIKVGVSRTFTCKRYSFGLEYLVNEKTYLTSKNSVIHSF